MSGLDFVTNSTKMIMGILSIIFGIVAFFLTSTYVPFYYIMPFFVVAICLIVPSDKIKNDKRIGGLFAVISLIVMILTIMVVINPYDVVTNLYVSGQFTTAPGASEISACVTAYIIAFVYALYNLLCSLSFFLTTSGEDDFK